MNQWRRCAVIKRGRRGRHRESFITSQINQFQCNFHLYCRRLSQNSAETTSTQFTPYLQTKIKQINNKRKDKYLIDERTNKMQYLWGNIVIQPEILTLWSLRVASNGIRRALLMTLKAAQRANLTEKKNYLRVYCRITRGMRDSRFHYHELQ
jgi:hypothetical protein